MVKRRLFIKSICFVLLVAGAFIPLRLTAQNNDSVWHDKDYLLHSQPLLQSGNVTGLHYLPVASLSDVNLSIQRNTGSFINYYQSDNSLRYTVNSDSYYRLNDKTVFQGSVSYQNFTGKNMQGSAWIDPYKYPLDIDEYADSTAGTKKLENYFLLGAVSLDFGTKWTLGGSIQYTAANYAKIKDMRHVNKLLDLDLDVAASYRVSNKDELGLSLSYGRRIESLSFSISGNTDKQYMSLINFGSFYGTAELHSLNGYTADENPMVDLSKKIAITYMHSFPGITWLNSFSYGKRNGYFGVKSSTDIEFTEHSGHEFQYRGILSQKTKRWLHTFSFTGSYRHLNNGQTVYQKETSTGGNTVIAYYGLNNVLNQSIWNGMVVYESFFHFYNDHPLWTLTVRGNYQTRSQTVTLYPYYRTQLIRSYEASLLARRNFIIGKNNYGIFSDLLFGAGGGTAKNDGQYASSSTSQSAPASRDRYLYQEYEYLTKPRLKGMLGFKYASLITGTTNVFLQFSYSYTRAFNVHYEGNHLNEWLLTMGYEF